MVYLNLNDRARRTFSGIGKLMNDKQFIESELAKWLVSDERQVQIDSEAYYEGRQEILDRRRTVIGENGKLMTVENLPNNRLVDNQYAKMVDQKANYLCGRPISFDTENEAYGSALARLFSPLRQRAIRTAAETALIGGKAFIMPYYAPDGSGELMLEVFPAHEVLPFWRDAAHTELDCALHYYQVYEYDANGVEQVVNKVEVFHAGGIERFIYDAGGLIPDPDASSGAYTTVSELGKAPTALNWSRIPLVCFKANRRELPLLSRVRCLQDALNLMLSDLANNMEEDVHHTVLVIHNYDGEDLGEFRRNLATYGAVKVRSVDGVDGGVDTLEVTVNTENSKAVIELLKKAIIENARGFDAKDDRLSGSPNQLNIRSMYSDMDLDANVMESEFKAAFEQLFFFINAYFANAGIGSFDGETADVIFDRDVLINESESIDNCVKSASILSRETNIKQHPWVSDPVKELERLDAEREVDAAAADAYAGAFAGAAMSDE